MKAKITRGKTFKGLLNYIFDLGSKATRDKIPFIVGGNMAGASPQQLTREFVAARQLRPDIERAVWHCSLSLPPGERPTNEQWNEITKDFMEGMGFSDYTPYVAVRHNDKEHDHIHIVASRIGGDSKVWVGKWEAYKAIEVTQRLEEKYDLTRVAFKPAQKKRPTYKELHKAERTGVTPPRVQLQELIDEVVADQLTAPQLAQRLEEKGVIVRANVASTGRMNGFSFELDGLAFKGSSLGKAYSWSGLQKRGITYNVETDAVELERYRLPVEERPSRTNETVPETSSSPLTVQTSLLIGNDPNIATADTEETSPQTEKMLKALEGYYQSQINKNDETQESRAKEDLGNFSQPETAPTDTDFTDTDTTELSSVKEALETTLEEMEKITESMRATIDRDNRDNYTQGESPVRAEEFSSLTAPPIEDTAQKEDTEAVPEITTPEATQPPVDKCAYSKALATEASPETTQPPTDKCALSEIPQEQNQQQEWVESLVPDLAQLLVDARTHQLEGKHRTLTWDKEQQRLTLRENETQEIVLDAKWRERRWQDNGSNLTAAFFEQIKQALDIHNSEREQELHRQRNSGGFELE